MRAQNFAAALLLVVSSVLTPAAAGDRVPAAGGDIEITPILHASLQIEHAGTVIQVDPWSLGDLSHAKPADLILITDDVGHHLDVKAIQQLRKPGAPVIITANGKAKLADGMVLANGAKVTAAGVNVEAIAAYDIKPGEPSHPKGEANGYLITLGGKRIYLAGVTECVRRVHADEHPAAADDTRGGGGVHQGDRAEDRLPLSLRPAGRGATHEPARELGAAGRRAERCREPAGVPERAEGHVDRIPGCPLVPVGPGGSRRLAGTG